MTGSTDDGLIAIGENRGAGSAGRRYVDIHCHCLAGLDDGPTTQAQSVALCRELAYDGIATVIATPHQLGKFERCNEAGQVREKVAALNDELQSRGVALSVVPGGDVRVDEKICRLLESDRILTLADGGKYILLELPHEVFINIEALLVDLASLGIGAVISHPERHRVLARQPRVLCRWFEHGACLQVTAGSLLGDFGIMAQKAAWDFLNSGLASFVATDSHDLRGRRPRMKAAFERISIKLGVTTARLLCIENPLRVLKGQDIRIIRTVNAGKYIDETVPNSY